MVTAVALSGGIDSLVAAFLLRQQGEDIIGIHFLTGYESYQHRGFDENPTGMASNAMAAVADQLGVPVHVVDSRGHFKSTVVDYFTASYGEGRTPNPCVVCNQKIKFGLIAQAAKDLGASCIATGHYARIEAKGQRLALRKGLDPAKDQSYFLSMLTQEQMALARFPLGTMTKNAVRRFARDHDLRPVSKSESQDICFIRDKSYHLFLEKNLADPPRPGPIVDRYGKVLGTHKGLHRYTIGQRRGIDCPASAPYYVLRLDVNHNRLVVGFKEQLHARGCYVSNVNWIAGIPDCPVRIQSRIRYRHRPIAATLNPIDAERAVIEFDRPEPAVTPGQVAACYQNDEIIAAGWIEDPLDDN